MLVVVVVGSAQAPTTTTTHTTAAQQHKASTLNNKKSFKNFTWLSLLVAFASRALLLAKCDCYLIDFV
jgi:hypothetical protein